MAIRLSGHAIWAESPLFSFRRNRPLARKRHERRRRNRTSGRVSWPASVVCSAELATRGGENKHARNTRTKYRLWGVASVVCSVAFFIPAGSKPVAAKELSDLAVSADSPLLFPCRNPPLGRTKVASAEKWDEALLQQRGRCVSPPRNSPCRRGETNARATSKSSRHYCGLAMVISPARLTTREDRNRPGRNICTKRQFGILA